MSVEIRPEANSQLFRATIIVLYRPFIIDTPREIPVEQQESWTSFVCRKTRTAACSASSAVTSLIAEDLLCLSHTITLVPPLLPPPQSKVFELLTTPDASQCPRPRADHANSRF